MTTDFAISYLLDDCYGCPENKDGECMTQSHCFEVKQMAIKALKQFGVLQEIRQEIEKPLRDERCFDTADAKAQYIALNWVCELIDKHIKEIEG